ncbi:CvpA family protein [Sporolactobacillus pectinivorans]|uniref:CvpA family protein n=1 Tax=Sporolactobacillus pectinivorans TaxID=1591408 RepID=UPI001EFE9745|nr:CvpA family protein [Sporolactobacillus pectinivorans]
MLFNIIILVLLAWGFFIGFKRGLVLQLVHLAGFVVAYIVAFMYYKQLTPVVKLWVPFPTSAAQSGTFSFLGNMNLQSAYYQAIAFLMLFIATKIVLAIFGHMLDFLAELPLIRSVNHLTGGLFGFAEFYLVIFILLYVGALTPISGLQSSINSSSLAQSIIGSTPVFSKMLHNMWMALIFVR